MSAEGILSLHPDAILTSENNIGPPQVVEQLKQLNIPVTSFTAKNDSPEGTKALIREIGYISASRNVPKNFVASWTSRWRDRLRP